MEGLELKEGKERVQAHLIEPMQRIGMTKKRSVTAEAHEAMLEELRARLAYMDRLALEALQETVGNWGEGPIKNFWPPIVSIVRWARRLQVPPESESRLVRSYLQSAAGQRALDGGYAAELLRYLKTYGQPPNAFAITQVCKEAADNRRTHDQLTDRAARGGILTMDQQAWLDGYDRAGVRAASIINQANAGADA